MENVTHGYKKPNILDVKLGARLWDNSAPIAKREKLDKVAAETTSKPLGFRIAGMKTFCGTPNNAQEGTTADGYKVYDKMYGRSFTVDNVDESFGAYFLLDKDVKAAGPIKKVIKRFIDDLEALQEVIEKEESRMYSASLLFVYEGEQETLRGAFAQEKEILDNIRNDTPHLVDGTNSDGQAANGLSDGDEDADGRAKLPAIQSLKLIDFAHAEWTPGQGPDENLIHGIRSIIKVLKELA